MQRISLTLCLALSAMAFVPASSEARSRAELKVERIAGPFNFPWGMAFLPDGDMLVTERDGTLRHVSDGHISAPLAGLPDVLPDGQGGLLDVATAPDFARSRTIYLSFSAPEGVGPKTQTALASARLSEGGSPRLEAVKILFRQQPAFDSGYHFGSRIIVADDGTLLLTTGDRGKRGRVQTLANHLGKIIRINADGSVPRDNPFVGVEGALPEIYSLGHRNPQGFARRADGAIFSISHGARGGDEVNRVEAGRNYGWPEISYGTHYSGWPFAGTSRAGMEQPLWYWDPSIAPSGATFYEGDLFPEWQGHLFVGALRGEAISRLVEQPGGRFEEVERLFGGEFGRIRDVRLGPDGALWFLTDDYEGGLYRVSPQ